MSFVSQAQLELIRSRPHRTKLYLSIFSPTTVLACQVNDGSIARNDYVIAFDSVTSGSWTAVESGMTLLVGTSAGADDVGRIRVRSITSNQITVAENSDINWQDGLYLTVLRYWEVWPVFPRIISDPSDAENTLWYKDYDVAYTNQNTVLGAFLCAGPHRAAFLDGGSATLYYSATGTSHVADVGMSYHWFFEGATVTGSNALTPGNISYTTPGHYTTRLIVSGTNGTVDKTYRYASIYDRPETGSQNVPITRWSMGNIEGSRSGGGYTVSFTLHESITLHEGDVVVLFGESWYGTEKTSIGGNAVGNSDIYFVGHILKNSIQYNYKLGETTFEVGSITQYMKEQEGFSISVESSAAPAYWYQLYDMDINKAMYHYLRWQSTVLYLNDFQSLVNDRPIQYFDSDRTSLYDAVDNLVRGSVLGGLTADMQGRIWAEHGAQAFPSLSNQTYSTPVCEILKQDWIGSPRISEQLIPASSYIEYGGIAFSGVVTGTFSPLMANAPGSTPLYRGKAERRQGLALTNQTELNGIVGNTLANNNYRYPNIDYQLGGSYRFLDVAPQEKFTLQVEADDTPRGVAISGSFMPERVSWLYNPQKQSFLPSTVGFVPLTSGLAGQTIAIPDTPPDDGVTQPPRSSPQIPVLTYPSLFSVATSSDWVLFNIDTGGGDVDYANTFVHYLEHEDSRNNPVTYGTDAGFAYVIFKSVGLYLIGITMSLQEDGAGPTDMQALALSSTFNQTNIYGSNVVDGGQTDYSYFTFSGLQYIYPSTDVGTFKRRVGDVCSVCQINRLAGTASNFTIYNSSFWILKIK